MGLFRRKKVPSVAASAPTRLILSRKHKEDIPCGCGYNLRGLTFGTRCPECGCDSRIHWERHLAFNSSQSENAVSFVLDVARKLPKGSHVTAVEFCHVCKRAVGQCGSEPA